MASFVSLVYFLSVILPMCLSQLFPTRTGTSFLSNLFPLPTNLFSPKVRRSEFILLSSRIDTLEATIRRIQVSILELQRTVGNIRPKCPSGASGAEVIGNLCFSLEITPQRYNEAKTQCFMKGGMLAEPLTTDDEFYARIVRAFPVASNTVSASQIYVGIIAEGTNFIYESNDIVIPNNDPRWQVTPATPVANDAGALMPLRNGWDLVEVPNRNTVARPYICQFETVLN